MSLSGIAGGRVYQGPIVKALRKDVLGEVLGGDITRKKKLLEKQKKGSADENG